MRRNKYCSVITTFICLVFSHSIFAGYLCADEQQANKTANSGKEGLIEPQEYKVEALRDPFQSYLAKEGIKDITGENIELPAKPLPSLTVQGIIWGGKVPQAIINNKVLKTGDIIEEVKIIAISNKGITVSFSGQEYNLSTPVQSGPGKKSEGGLYE